MVKQHQHLDRTQRLIAYKRPIKRQEHEISIKNSRFITSSACTPDKASADAFIQTLRNEHPSANHNCWTHVIGQPEDARGWGCSDDGEPKGTAGRPMLNVLSHSGVGDITVVVTRYFGGIKLGTGGLVRAYSQAVREALEHLEVEPVIPHVTLRINADFSMTGQVEYLINQFDLQVLERAWEKRLSVLVRLPEDTEEALRQSIAAFADISLESCE